MRVFLRLVLLPTPRFSILGGLFVCGNVLRRIGRPLEARPLKIPGLACHCMPVSEPMLRCIDLRGGKAYDDSKREADPEDAIGLFYRSQYFHSLVLHSNRYKYNLRRFAGIFIAVVMITDAQSLIGMQVWIVSCQ